MIFDFLTALFFETEYANSMNEVDATCLKVEYICFEGLENIMKKLILDFHPHSSVLGVHKWSDTSCLKVFSTDWQSWSL